MKTIEQHKAELIQLAQTKGIKNYCIIEGTDRKTQTDIIVLIDEDKNGKEISKRFI